MADRQELRAAAERRIGRTVGAKFTLTRLLGVGGMAAVYEATHRNGKRCALKLLHPALATSERQRKRFTREAYVANTIEHEGVVQIHDDGVDDDGTAYLVMELLQGETLGAMQRRLGGKVDLSIALDVTDQLLDVLVAAHARGVIHRDIKPDNLFITRRGQLKVLDFGIARLFEQLPGGTVETQDGVMLGTPAFMPQEQARGRWDELDGRSDVWAVGATLFTLLTGEVVHPADTPQEQLGRAMTVPARSLSALCSDLPADVVDFVDRALRFEKTERWPSAHAMQQALRSLGQRRDSTPELARAALGAAVTVPEPLIDSASLLTPRTARASVQPPKLRRYLAFVAVLALIWIALVMLRPTRVQAPAPITKAPPGTLAPPTRLPALPTLKKPSAPTGLVAPAAAKSDALATSAPADATPTSSSTTPASVPARKPAHKPSERSTKAAAAPAINPLDVRN